MVRGKDEGREWRGRKETQGVQRETAKYYQGFLELVRSGQACEVCPTILVWQCIDSAKLLHSTVPRPPSVIAPKAKA